MSERQWPRGLFNLPDFSLLNEHNKHKTPVSFVRIVMVLPTYLPESYGGAEQQARRMSQALVRVGARVTLLAPRLKRDTPAKEKEGLVAVRRFKLRDLPNLGGRHFDSFLLWCAWVMTWLFRHRHDYDVIHVIHGRLHAFPAVVAGRWFGKPVIVKLGRGGEKYFDLSVVRRKRLLGRFFAGRILRYTTAWVANSREIIDDLQNWSVPVDRIHAIPNGIAIPENVGSHSNNGVIQFLSIGRLDPEKAIDQMIHAFAALQSDSPALLTILGDGKCREELLALTRQLGQQERIVFRGSVDDVTPFLKQADFYLSTSLSEGMSNALLEAMSFAVPPIVSRVSGVSDLVEDGISGLLFPPGDKSILLAQLHAATAMTLDRRRRMGKAAQATIRERFSIELSVKQNLELYKSLIDCRTENSDSSRLRDVV
jgi:glycosyltransferase involved in cell wall biosynthesis